MALMSEPQQTNAPSGRTLTLWQLMCFGVLTMPLAMGGLAFALFIPTFYAVDVGLGLTATGVIFAAGRLIDVFTDPAIGHLSDETRSKWGARRPWIVLGAPLYCIAVGALLSPPDGAGLLYLIAASTAYFLLYTIVDVPYSSIGLEISPHLHERSLLASSKAVFQVMGALTAASIPFVLALPADAALQTTAKFIIGLTVFGVVVFLLFMPSSDRTIKTPRHSLWTSTKIVLKVPAFRLLLVSFFIVQAANALTAGLTVLFVTHVIGQPQLIGAFLGLLFLATALFLPVWVLISHKSNKKTAWICSIAFCTVVLICAFTLTNGSVVGAALLCVALGACFGCDAIMPTSMLADIVYHYEERGENRFAGVFLAVKNAVSKLTFVIPMAIAFPVLDLVGFREASANGPAQLQTLLIFFAAVPIVLRIGALILLSRSTALPFAAPALPEGTHTA